MFSKILIVDDDVKIVEWMEEALADMNVEILKAYNGKEALDIIPLKKPDVIITDLTMPVMDGRDLFEKSRNLSPSPTFIFMTGYGSIPDARDSIKRGVFDYLEKPFSMSKLRVTLSNALEYHTIRNENRYLKSKLEISEDRLQDVDLSYQSFQITRDILEYTARFSNNDSEEDLLRKLLRASVEITSSTSGSIYLYNLSPKKMNYQYKEFYSAGCSHEKAAEHDPGIVREVAIGFEDSCAETVHVSILPVSLDAATGIRSTQGCLSIPIENPFKSWGVLYLSEKIQGDQYSFDDIANVTTLVRDVTEKLTALGYRRQQNEFMRDSRRVREEYLSLKTQETLPKLNRTFNLMLDDELKVQATSGDSRELREEFGIELSSYIFDIPVFKEMRKEDKERMRYAAESNQTFACDDLLFIHKDKYKYIDARLIPMPFSLRDNSYSYLAVLEDVTERERIRRKTTKLRDLSVFSRFMAGIAHDLNNPLDGLSRLIKILESKYGDASNAEYFDRINVTTQRMSQKIQSCFDSARKAVNKECMQSICRQLDDALAIMTPLFVEKGIQINKVVRTPKAGVGASIDLYDIFLNLIKNAYEAIGRNGHLDIFLLDNESNKHVDIVFRDSGCGFPEGVSDSLSIPFFTTKKNGMGLGLALCERTIESCGGRLTFKNVEEGGAEVTVSLPV